MDSNEIPTYSNEGYLGFSVLLTQTTDVIIYIEDEKGIHIYETLMGRLLSDTNTEIRVEAVSGKKNLMDIYEKNKLEEAREHLVPCFFIADLDFDEIKGKIKSRDDNFLYLERYSIENYLVDEEVGINFVKGRTNENKTLCKSKIDFSKWIKGISNQAKKLVTIFITVQKLRLPVDNAKLPIVRFTKDKTPHEIDERKVGSYLVKKVFKDYRRNKMYGFTREYLSIDRKISALYGSEIQKIIPGKQLLQLYIFYLSCFTDGKGVNRIDFENIACHCCDLSSPQFLKEGIINYLENHRLSKAG